MPKMAQLGQQPQKCLCVGYLAVNSLLPPVVKAYSKASSVLLLVPLPKLMNYTLC